MIVGGGPVDIGHSLLGGSGGMSPLENIFELSESGSEAF